MHHGHETAVTIPGPVPLHGVLHGCCRMTEAPLGLVFCDPFAEEKKCSQRVLVEAARAFCSADIGCLRFDYRGTGDSPGEFVGSGPGEWLEDIAAAVAFARKALAVERVGLLGLRLGGTLAATVAHRLPGVGFLALWEPVLDGKQFMAQNLRRSLIKAMLTKGEEFDAGEVRQAHTDEVFDFDGYRITGETRARIEALNLLESPPEFVGPAFIANLTSRETPLEGYQRLGETLGATVHAVRQEPFWNRIGLVDPRPVVEVTELWLAEQQAAWLEQSSRPPAPKAVSQPSRGASRPS